MSSLLMSRRDLEFLLYEWLDIENLLQRKEYRDYDRETIDAVLELAEQVATRHFAPHNRRSDLEEPQFDGSRVTINDEVAPALKAYFEAGFGGLAMPTVVGGGGMPIVAAQAAETWFSAANTSTLGYAFLTKANANLLLAHASPDQVDTWVPPMLEGRYFGTMCLSEPQAGSSLADVLTRAEPQPDGTYLIRGNKMWISGGDHDLSENIVHLVLARVRGAPAGVKGLSLFIAPKVLPDGSRNDVWLAGLNHKMGNRGTTNTSLNFGEHGGARGYLIGDEGKGLAYMFHMMNETRLGVGMNAVALGYTGYLHALDYARSRLQGRPAGQKDPASSMTPIIEHPDVRRMLLASKSYVEGGLALGLYCGRLIDEERTGDDPDAAHLLLEILTPIAKAWPSQWCLVANDHAIQVHGGYGYSRDYPVEQFWRDNRLNAIHEGTNGIQALDLLGRKVVMHDGAALTLLSARIRETIDTAGALDGRVRDHAEALYVSLGRVLGITSALWASGDAASALMNASVYLEAFGHVVLAWIWLEQEVAAHGKKGNFYDGKRAAAEFFFTWELPRTEAQFALLASGNSLVREIDTASL
jgi:alkylation response protein AidB-like acyl-CoA dehydrogenase